MKIKVFIQGEKLNVLEIRSSIATLALVLNTQRIFHKRNRLINWNSLHQKMILKGSAYFYIFPNKSNGCKKLKSDYLCNVFVKFIIFV